MRDVKSSREQFFALGIALGTALGIVIGSTLALRIGHEGIEALRQVTSRLFRRDDGPKFELLLQ